MNNLATLYWFMRKFDRAILLFEETLGLEKTRQGLDHRQTIQTAFNLGVNYRDAGRLDDAVALFDEWLPRSKVVLIPGHPTFALGLSMGGETYSRAGRHDKAEPLYREAFECNRKSHGETSPRAVSALLSLCTNLIQQKKYADAESLLRKCLKIREQKEPDDWRTFNTKSMLGGSLLGQKNYAEAEPLLLSGYEGMKQREAKIPPDGKIRLKEALDRLVQLYDAWGKPEKATEWRKKLPVTKSAKPAEPKKD
jgi:tetratricopeptide (TPR) repeat protein